MLASKFERGTGHYSVFMQEKNRDSWFFAKTILRTLGSCSCLYRGSMHLRRLRTARRSLKARDWAVFLGVFDRGVIALAFATPLAMVDLYNLEVNKTYSAQRV